MFLLKIIVILLLLITAGYAVNIMTRRFRQKREFKIYHAIAFLAIFLGLLLRVLFSSTQVFHDTKSVTHDITEELLKNANYQVDVSELPEGSPLKVVLAGNGSINNQIVVGFLQRNDNDKILIYYEARGTALNDVNLNEYTKPELETSLKDNVLTVYITAQENRKVVMLYPFSFLQRFTCYKDNRYYKPKPGISIYNSIGDGIVWILPPEAKNLSIIAD